MCRYRGPCPAPWGPLAPHAGVPPPGAVAPADARGRCHPGQLVAGAGGHGGRVPVAVRAAGRAEGRDGDEDQAGLCQPHLRAAGQCPPCLGLPPTPPRHPRPPLPLSPPHARPSWRRVPRPWRAPRSCWRRPTRPWGRPTTMTSPRCVPTGAGRCPRPAAPHPGGVLTPLPPLPGRSMLPQCCAHPGRAPSFLSALEQRWAGCACCGAGWEHGDPPGTIPDLPRAAWGQRDTMAGTRGAPAGVWGAGTRGCCGGDAMP